MGSKLIFVGILLALVLLVSSEVAAATEVAETTNAVDPSAVNDIKDGGYGNGGNGRYNGGGNGHYSGGGHGGNGGGNNGGGHGGNGRYNGGGRGGYCRYGCCGRSYSRGSCRCCSFAGEKPDAVPQN